MVGRWFMGSTGAGGATRWQRYITKDYTDNGGTNNWVVVRDWGAGPWYTNATFDVWRGVTGGTITNRAWVQMRHRYDDGGYYWCSWWQEHPLFSYSSYQWGTATC